MSEDAAPPAADAPEAAPPSLSAMLADPPPPQEGQPSDADSLAAYMRGEEKPEKGEANPFLDGLTDPDVKAYVERKGFKSPEDVAKAYANLERLASRDAQGRVLLPKDETDAEGYERVYAALGRPETPEAYGLSQLEGVDPEFSSEAAKWLHKAGVSGKGALALAQEWNAYVSARADAAEKDFQARSQAEWAGLRSELGQNFEASLEQAKRGAMTFGVTGDDMAALERTLGPAKTAKLFAKIGSALGEDKFIEGDNSNAKFGMSPEQAKARIDTLRGDPAWMARWVGGGAAEKQEYERLVGILGRAA